MVYLKHFSDNAYENVALFQKNVNSIIGCSACDCKFYPCACNDPDLEDLHEALPPSIIERLRKKKSFNSFLKRALEHPERMRTFTLCWADFLQSPFYSEEADGFGDQFQRASAIFAFVQWVLACDAGLTDFEVGHETEYDEEVGTSVISVTILFAHERDVLVFERALRT